MSDLLMKMLRLDVFHLPVALYFQRCMMPKQLDNIHNQLKYGWRVRKIV
jgi:hypothetical protein